MSSIRTAILRVIDDYAFIYKREAQLPLTKALYGMLSTRALATSVVISAFPGLFSGIAIGFSGSRISALIGAGLAVTSIFLPIVISSSDRIINKLSKVKRIVRKRLESRIKTITREDRKYDKPKISLNEAREKRQTLKYITMASAAFVGVTSGITVGRIAENIADRYDNARTHRISGFFQGTACLQKEGIKTTITGEGPNRRAVVTMPVGCLPAP